MANKVEDTEERAKVALRAEFQNVAQEKEALRRRLAELEMKEEDIGRKVKGKNINEELQERRQAEGNKAKEVPTVEGEGVGSLWKNMKGASASSSTVNARATKKLEPGVRVKAESGQEYVMTTGEEAKEKGSKDQAMRRTMYDQQVEAGIFKPGPKAKYDAMKVTEHVKCKHPFETLRW